MNTKKPFTKLFAASSRLTDAFPHRGARILDGTLAALLGSRRLVDSLHRKNVQRLRYLREFNSILVIGDLNIGDAVNLQAAVSGLRDFFPDAEIDFIMNRFARCLVHGNPEITNLWPIFTGAYIPDPGDFPRVEEIVALHRYNLILNFCPVFRESRLVREEEKVVNYTGLGVQLVHNEFANEEANHIAFRSYRFVHDLFAAFLKPKRESRFRGVRVTLADRAVQQAIDFMKQAKLLYASRPVIFFNPDASSLFTLLPPAKQVEMLGQLVRSGYPVLLGSGYTEKNIENLILAMLPPQQRRRITVVPQSIPLDTAAVLADFSDVFISADTGPLHIAAARKYSASGNYRFRNRTAVVSIFGATPSRIYGYASGRPGYFPANQDAPSFAFVSGSPCRNITCINKMAKTCRSPRCYETFDASAVAGCIKAYLSGTGRSVLDAAAARAAARSPVREFASLLGEEK